MLKQRRKAAEIVAAQFLRAETSAAEAAEAAASCVSMLLQQRAAANLPVATGLAALQLVAQPAAPAPQRRGPSESAVAFARRLQKLHRARSDNFSPGLFADPAWEILLDLFVCGAEGRRLSVSAACVGASCSAATALRYLGLLGSSGVVLRTPDARDRRRVYVELTPDGRTAVERLLGTHLDD